MTKRKVGRPAAPSPLAWRCVVRLTEERGHKLERLAARRELPVATVVRQIINEGLDRIDDGRDDV